MSGLAEDALVREDFGKALLSQVVVPRLREALVLCVSLRVIAVIAFADTAAPLLNRYIVLCEAPDYVKSDREMQSGRGISAF